MVETRFGRWLRNLPASARAAISTAIFAAISLVVIGLETTWQAGLLSAIAWIAIGLPVLFVAYRREDARRSHGLGKQGSLAADE